MPFVAFNFHLKTPQKAFLFLMNHFNISQKEAQRMIARGRVFVDEKPMTHTAAVLEGAFKVVRFEAATQNNPPIFKTQNFALFDKPSGILVHPNNRNTPYSLIDEVKYHLGDEANIVHRIDQETSGLVLASANKTTEILLKEAFEHRQIKKEYLALVHGTITQGFLIDAPIDRYHDTQAVVKIMMRIDKSGKPSQTYIEPLYYDKMRDMTMVVAKPSTGRQHQIRLHLAHVGHPIVGDPLYNVPIEVAANFLERNLSRQERLYYSKAHRLLLHANRLYFTLNGVRYDIYSHIDFKAQALKALG